MAKRTNDVRKRDNVVLLVRGLCSLAVGFGKAFSSSFTQFIMICLSRQVPMMLARTGAREAPLAARQLDIVTVVAQRARACIALALIHNVIHHSICNSNECTESLDLEENCIAAGSNRQEEKENQTSGSSIPLCFAAHFSAGYLSQKLLVHGAKSLQSAALGAAAPAAAKRAARTETQSTNTASSCNIIIDID